MRIPTSLSVLAHQHLPLESQAWGHHAGGIGVDRDLSRASLHLCSENSGQKKIRECRFCDNAKKFFFGIVAPYCVLANCEIIMFPEVSKKKN